MPAAAADPGEAARQWMARLIALEESQQRIQRENAELRNELNQARGERDEATERAQASAQAPASTRPNDTVDTRLIGRPETFDGKDENWSSFALVLKAYVAAISPRMLELIKKSEDPAFDVDNALLSNEDERWSCQLYYVLAMLCKGRSQDKVELAGEGEGAALWRSLLEEYEPRYRSRTTCLMQKLLTFRFDGDVLASLERFDRAVKVYEKSSGRALDQIIKMGVVTNGLAAHPDDSLRKLADHVVLNSARVDTYDKLRRELHEVVGTKRFLGTQSGGAVDAVAKGRGRKGDGKGGGGKTGATTGQITIKFSGTCWVCGKAGHKSHECWHGDGKTTKPPAPPQPHRAAARGAAAFPGKCNKCGKFGHKAMDCKSSAGSSSQPPGVKRPRTRDQNSMDLSELQSSIAELSSQCAALVRERGGAAQLSNIMLASVGSSSLHAVGPGRSVTIGVDSGAELSVWPEDLYDDVETKPTPESIAGVRYWGAGDREQPSIPDKGKRCYELSVNGEARKMTARVAPVRKALLAVCDLNDRGHNVHFMADGRAWAEHATTGARTPFTRRGGRYEIEALVAPPDFRRRGASL